MKTLEQFFRDNGIILTENTVGYKMGKRGKIIEGDYTLRVTKETDGGVCFYIYPTGRNGDTTFFIVKGNEITNNDGRQ